MYFITCVHVLCAYLSLYVFKDGCYIVRSSATVGVGVGCGRSVEITLSCFENLPDNFQWHQDKEREKEEDQVLKPLIYGLKNK